MTYRYKTVKRNGKTVLLHRWLMSQKLGRELLPSEHVHHINEDPHDNRIENLELVDPIAHQDIHHPCVHPKTKRCEICGVEFTPHKTKRKRQKTCGAARCRSALIAVNRHGVSRAEALVRANVRQEARAVA